MLYRAGKVQSHFVIALICLYYYTNDAHRHRLPPQISSQCTKIVDTQIATHIITIPSAAPCREFEAAPF